MPVISSPAHVHIAGGGGRPVWVGHSRFPPIFNRPLLVRGGPKAGENNEESMQRRKDIRREACLLLNVAAYKEAKLELSADSPSSPPTSLAVGNVRSRRGRVCATAC